MFSVFPASLSGAMACLQASLLRYHAVYRLPYVFPNPTPSVPGPPGSPTMATPELKSTGTTSPALRGVYRFLSLALLAG